MVKTLTAADDGATITAQPGDELLVRLDENPTTGYRWQIDRLQGPLELAQDSYQLASGGQIGGGGVREFRFRAAAPGTAHLALKHWQSWEGDDSVNHRFSIDLAITT